jgi:lysophospholipase L1-like esterase
VDLFSKSGIDSNNLKQFTADNLHPNDAGYQMISKVIIDDLKAIK